MHQTCPSKFWLRIKNNWTTRRKSAALSFGGVVHVGVAAWYRGNQNLADALNAIGTNWPPEHPVDDWRDMGKAVNVMTEYHHTYYKSEFFEVIGLGTEGVLVERPFTLETGMYLSCLKCGPEAGKWEGPPVCPNCGEPLEAIEYGGIIDAGVYDSVTKRAWVLEHKTASKMDDYYFDAFKPNNQITGYVWGLSKLTNKPVGGALINAIGLYKSQKTRFERQPTTRSPRDIETWLENVRAVCEEIQWHERTGHWPMRTGNCKTVYGNCEFHSVHVLDDPIMQQKRLEQDYVKGTWDYEKRD